jgi:hypothetical protein
MAKTVPTPDVAALLAANRRAQSGGDCSVGQALTEMDEATRRALTVAIADRKTYSARGLAEVFAQLGYPLTDNTLGRHIRGGCLCGKR